MRYSRRALSLATLLLVFAAVGAAVAWRLLDVSETDAAEAEGTPEDSLLVPDAAPAQFSASVASPVQGAEVVRDTLWIRVSAAGQAEAYRRTTLTAQVEGAVRSLPVRENQVVGAGALLVQIDTVEAALELAQARAELLTAEAGYREMILFNDEIEDPEVRAERERIARSRSGLDQAEVSLQQAELQLERTRVTAPFDGRVANLVVVEGEHVTAGTELLTIIDLDPIKVEVQVLESELRYLSEGRRATLSFNAYPGEEFLGQIETINPVVDPETSTGRVTVLLRNGAGRIKPGMYAEVSLDAEALPDRVMVPRSAVVERDRRPVVFVYEEGPRGGLAKWRYVNPGRENETHVEILPEGPEQGMVEPGEIVLVDGHHYLAHDTPIRLVEDVEAAGGRPTR